MSNMTNFYADSEFRIDNGKFSLKKYNNKYATLSSTVDVSKKKYKKTMKAALRKQAKAMDEHQQKLYAQNKFSILCVFQAIDAAGKDSTIRHVFGRLNPAGFQVHSFKAPSKEELDHDFLWRTSKSLPERGRIGIFNRSYYEEALVVKVHPEYLTGQRIDGPETNTEFWQNRYDSINAHERHLARNGTAVLKFWLNVSKDEQCRRFISRIDEPAKNWKFSSGDLVERQHWDEYMQAYEECIKATATPWAPWYIIPADNKLLMRLRVSEIIKQTMNNMPLAYPALCEEQQAKLASYRESLVSGY